MLRTLCCLALAGLVLADVGCSCFKKCFHNDRRCDAPCAPPPGPIYTGPPVAGPPAVAAPVQYGPPPCATPVR